MVHSLPEDVNSGAHYRTAIRFMRLFRNHLGTLLFCSLLHGCASQPTPAGGTGQTLATTAVRSKLTASDSGLEVLRWTVVGNATRFPEALLKHEAGPLLDAATRERLQRNGVRLVRIPAELIDQLLMDSGGASINTNEWHGQAPEWRPLVERPVELAGRAVAIDGRVRRYERGAFRLMMRSWTVPMEDGPRVHLELVPQHARPSANNIRRLLGERDEPIEGFGSGALDLQLEPGYAYVLVGESPQAEWARQAEANPKSASPSLPPRLAHKPRMGPIDPAGPESAAPYTLGELLLPVDRNLSTRGVLIFVPRIPEYLLPGQADDAGGLVSRKDER